MYLPDGSAAALFDVSQRRKAAAAWDTWLSLVAIGLLLLVLQLQMMTSLRLLLRPLERMLACVKLDAAHILDSVHLPRVQSCWIELASRCLMERLLEQQVKLSYIQLTTNLSCQV